MNDREHLEILCDIYLDFLDEIAFIYYKHPFTEIASLFKKYQNKIADTRIAIKKIN